MIWQQLGGKDEELHHEKNAFEEPWMAHLRRDWEDTPSQRSPGRREIDEHLLEVHFQERREVPGGDGGVVLRCIPRLFEERRKKLASRFTR